MGSLIVTVKSIIDKKGTSKYSLESISTSTLIDPDHPSKGSTKTSTSHPLRSHPAAYTLKQVTYGVAKKNDIKLYVDPSGMTVIPKTDDAVICTGERWNVKNVIIYTESDTPVLYILQIRK